MKMTPPTIYMPETLIDPVKNILREFTRIDRGRMPCSLKPIQPGDEIAISREYLLTVSATRHGVPSLGFVVWNRRRKLKAEYQGLAGEEIRDIRLGGTEVTVEQRHPIMAYLGDSAPGGLDDCPAMYEADVLICEMSFVAPGHRREKIHKYGHMHLDDIIERRDRFKNERIIAAHVSTRYHANTVKNIVAKRLPDMLDGRLCLWL